MRTGMLKRIGELRCIMTMDKEQGISMRRRLGLYWLCMALAVFAVLVMILSVTGMFSVSARKLKESLALQQQNAVTSLTGQMDALTAQCLTLSRQATRELTDTLMAHGKTFSQLNNDQALIEELETLFYPMLYTTLKSSACSGVFLILDATCNTAAPEAEHSRMGVYLRYSDLSSVNTANKHLIYFRGVPGVARKEKVQMHNRWNLEFDIERIPGYDEIINADAGRLADHVLWTERIKLTDTWEDVFLLCVPVKGNDGVIRGICGVEISELYFRLANPAVAGPYGDMLIALAPMGENTLYLNRAVYGISEDMLLESDRELSVKEGKYYNTYSSRNKSYLGLHQLLPAKSGEGRQLAAVTLMSEGRYRKAAAGERMLFIIGSIIFLMVMYLLSWVLSLRFASPITRLLEAVRQEEPQEEQRSGISEIDELVDYFRFKVQNQNANEGELPPDIEELFQSFTERVNTLTPTERTVLQYFIEGCTIEEIASKTFISVNTAKKHNTNLNRKLCITSREELSLYIDLFRRCDRLDEITYQK
ncbi:MAG: helix-turn-helix transcriptional regulator [Enterocloster sp.]